MANFWPKDIVIPSRSPLQILEEAREQWKKESGGVLSLYFDDIEPGIWDCYVVEKFKEDWASNSRLLFRVTTNGEDAYPASIALNDATMYTSPIESHFRTCLELAMNWPETKSAALNVAIAIDDQDKQILTN